MNAKDLINDVVKGMQSLLSVNDTRSVQVNFLNEYILVYKVRIRKYNIIQFEFPMTSIQLY